MDYHGLKLLWGWMVDASSGGGDSPENTQFKIDLLSTLSSLPVPNKTMLLDSKLLSIVEKWTIVVDTNHHVVKKEENVPKKEENAPKKEENAPKKEENAPENEVSTAIDIHVELDNRVKCHQIYPFIQFYQVLN